MAADIRCPKCGKSNPADAEVCRYCRAQLSPAMPGGGASGGAPSGDGDEPDWLRALRADEPGKGGKSPTAPANEPAADVPDWLSRIRQKANDSDQPSDSGLFADDDAGDSKPGWMKGLGGEEAESSAAGFGDADDWLSRLGGEPSAPAAPAIPDSPRAESGAGDQKADTCGTALSDR